MSVPAYPMGVQESVLTPSAPITVIVLRATPVLQEDVLVSLTPLPPGINPRLLS